MVVFIEVHHLKAVELSRHFMDLFLLAFLIVLDTFGVPIMMRQSPAKAQIN